MELEIRKEKNNIVSWECKQKEEGGLRIKIYI